MKVPQEQATVVVLQHTVLPLGGTKSHTLALSGFNGRKALDFFALTVS